MLESWYCFPQKLNHQQWMRVLFSPYLPPTNVYVYSFTSLPFPSVRSDNSLHLAFNYLMINYEHIYIPIDHTCKRKYLLSSIFLMGLHYFILGFVSTLLTLRLFSDMWWWLNIFLPFSSIILLYFSHNFFAPSAESF